MAKKKVKLKRGPKIILSLIILLIVICLGLNIKNNFSKEKEEEPKEQEKDNKISLVMVGDALIHSSVYDDAYEDGKYNFYKMLDPIKSYISSFDLAFYNQETVLGGVSLGLSSYPAFNSPQEVGDAFIDAGFNLVSLANNHILDKGSKAIISANNYWSKKKDVLTSGSYNSLEERNNIVIKEMNGIKYALLAYTTTTNGLTPAKSYYVNIYDEETVKNDIEKVRDSVDVLLVSMHWGEEYNNDIIPKQKEIANYLASLGVDIIIGTHPHVIEPIDYIGDTLVIYSLGNFLSGQEGIDRLIGLMVAVDIEKKEDKVTISNPSTMLTYTYYKNNNVKTDFKVYPFNMLNNSILNGYKNYYNKYMSIVTARTDRVVVLPI